MKYFVITLLLLSCEKPTNTITWQLTRGAGDVVITDGDLVTDFHACAEGWSVTREAKPKTRYTIWTNAKKLHGVAIRYNGKVVASDSLFCSFTTK